MFRSCKYPGQALWPSSMLIGLSMASGWPCYGTGWCTRRTTGLIKHSCSWVKFKERKSTVGLSTFDAYRVTAVLSITLFYMSYWGGGIFLNHFLCNYKCGLQHGSMKNFIQQITNRKNDTKEQEYLKTKAKKAKYAYQLAHTSQAFQMRFSNPILVSFALLLYI